MCWRFCRMSELLRTYQIGATKVEVWEDNVRTLLSPQLVVVAADTNMRRCIDHELAHTWLAHFYTGAASATMLRKAVEVLGFAASHYSYFRRTGCAGGTYRACLLPWPSGI
jgi:hypothetical protein